MKASISASLCADADVAQLARAVAGERGLGEDAAHRLEAAHEPVDVVALGEEIRVDAAARRAGSALASVTLPRLFGRSRQTWHE